MFYVNTRKAEKAKKYIWMAKYSRFCRIHGLWEQSLSMESVSIFMVNNEESIYFFSC